MSIIEGKMKVNNTEITGGVGEWIKGGSKNLPFRLT